MPETQASPTPDSSILDRIVTTKKAEIAALHPQEERLRAAVEDAPPPRDLARALRRPGEVAVMAEVKRRSPGAGPIRPRLDPAGLALDYEAAGAAAISVLTDKDYFGGSLKDLAAVRGAVGVPVFRKDFILHSLQLLEARGAGADGVLLIARILSQEALDSLHAQALDLGLTPLVEVHDQVDLERALTAGAMLIGINNRNLETFTTSLSVTLRLALQVPPQVTLVSESGIRSRPDVEELGRAGVHAVLVGESLLRASDPSRATRELVGRPRVGQPESGG